MMRSDAMTCPDPAQLAPGRAGGRILVDHTHCGRHVTGLERITLELFSREALAPLDVEIIGAASRARMMARQTFGLPARLAADKSALLLCPGFPPSLLTMAMGARVLPYIHDLFLLTRPQDLNIRARAYMVAPFAVAVRRLPRFLVNSETTAQSLRKFCRGDADIRLYRPRVRNVFGLSASARAMRRGGLRLVAVGTVEPRKNLLAAAKIVAALQAAGHTRARLDMVGRVGWGDDAQKLAAMPGVTLHGYQDSARVRELIENADALISTAHDEGLGLPLLEAQYAALPVIAPDKPVFREVLGSSGLFVDTDNPEQSAARIAAHLLRENAAALHGAAALANVERWNRTAEDDGRRTIDWIGGISRSFQAVSC